MVPHVQVREGLSKSADIQHVEASMRDGRAVRLITILAPVKPQVDDVDWRRESGRFRVENGPRVIVHVQFDSRMM